PHGTDQQLAAVSSGVAPAPDVVAANLIGMAVDEQPACRRVRGGIAQDLPVDELSARIAIVRCHDKRGDVGLRGAPLGRPRKHWAKKASCKELMPAKVRAAGQKTREVAARTGAAVAEAAPESVKEFGGQGRGRRPGTRSRGRRAP